MPTSANRLLASRDAANIYRVYAAPIAREEGGEELFRTNVRDGVALDWADKGILKLTITCGKVIRFKNVFDINDERGLLQRMTVRLDAEGAVNCV